MSTLKTQNIQPPSDSDGLTFRTNQSDRVTIGADGFVNILNGTVTGGITLNGTLNLIGGITASGGATFGGRLRVTDSTESSSTSTGALTVSGGVGVGGDFNVGGTASFNSNITGTVVGGLASSLLPTGSILQVVYSGTTASYTITSSFATTGFSATITPKRNNSKIYVLCSLNLLISNAAATGTSIHGRIVRNSTGIQDFSRLLYGADYNSTANHGGQQFILCQDTPNTTSSTTYTVHLYGSGTGGAYIMNYNATAPNTSPTWATSTMILVEVAV